MNYRTLIARLRRMPPELAISTAVGKRKPPRGGVEVDGVARSVREWARVTGIPAGAIYARLRTGWGAKEAVTTPVVRWFDDSEVAA